MANIATAYVQIVPTTKGISGSLTSSLGGEASSAGDTAGGLLGNGLVTKALGIISAAAIGTTIVKGISAAISAGGDLEQSIGGVQTLFANSMADASETVIANAKKAYETAGVSANQYMEQATSFAASLVSSLDGDVAKAAEVTDTAITDMADNSNKMGTAMQDIQNAYQGFAKQNYTMLDNLKLGYGGTQEEMKRLLKDAQEISGVKYDISNLSDVYEAIHVIQEDLGVTGTTAKEAATTLSGSFNMMKASAENALGAIALGENVGPALNELSETVSNYLFGNLIPMIGTVIASAPEALSSFIKGAWNSIKTSFSKELTSSLDDVQRIFSSESADASNTVIENAKRAYKSIGMTASDYMQESADLSSSILEALGGDVEKAAQVTDTAINDMADNVSKMGTNIEDVKSAYEGFAEKNYNMLDSLKLGYEGTQEGMEQLLKDAQEFSGVEYNIDNINDVYEAIHVVQSELGVTGSAAEETATTLSGSFDSMKAAIENTISSIAAGDNVMPALSDLKDAVTDFFSNHLMPAVVSGMKEALDGAADAIPEFVDNILDQLPSVMEAGKELVSYIGSGIQENAPDFAESAGELIGSLIGTIAEHLPDLIESGADVLSSLIEGFSESPETIIEAGSSFASGLIEGLGETDWGEVGKNILIAIFNGMTSVDDAKEEAKENLKGTVESTLQDVWSAACTWGNDISNDVADFINPLVADIGNKLSQLPGNIMGAISPAIQNVIQWGSGLVSAGIGAASQFISGVVSRASALPGKIWSAIVGAVSRVISWGSSLASAGMSAASRLVSSVVSGVSSLPSQMVSVGSNIVHGIISGVTNAAGSLLHKMQSLASDALSAAKSALGIKSPSRVFRDQVGQWIPAGIAAGITGNSSVVDKALEDLTDPLSSELNSSVKLNASATASGLRNADRETISASSIYAAVKAGMQDATIVTNLNGREVGRTLKGMGVSFA